MKSKYYLFLLLILFSSGIIRHDIDEKLYVELANQPQFNCVGILSKDNKKGGSCVLISKNKIITAAHCFIEKDNNKPIDVKKYAVTFGNNEYKIKNILVHPYFFEPQNKFNECDIAILELEEDINDIKPAKINFDENELSQKGVGVGYGMTGKANEPENIAFSSKKIAGENQIDKFDNFEFDKRGSLFLCDFDYPQHPEYNKMGSEEPLKLEYLCAAGDSGGGFFIQNNGIWYLAGICKGSTIDPNLLTKIGYYGQVMRWTRISVYNEWIKNNLKG